MPRRRGTPVSKHDFFIARQPIVDDQARLVAYELLFRGTGQGDHAVFDDGSVATAQLLNEGIGGDGLDGLVGDVATAFINFGRNLLTNGAALALQPASRFVVEVLEDVPPDAEVLGALADLRQHGLRIALDDVTTSDRVAEFGTLVDWVKIDIRAVRPNAVDGIIAATRKVGAGALAEKVESREEFRDFRWRGVQYFQGYLLGRPERMHSASLPSLPGPQARFVRAALEKTVDLNEMAIAVAADPTLTRRVLTLANSASAMTIQPVTSVKTAVVRAGELQLKRMAVVLAFAPAAGADLRVALNAVLMRACLADLVGAASRVAERFECFVSGILTGLDEYTGIKVESSLARAPMDPAFHAAQVSGAGAVVAVVEVARSYMVGDWARAAAAARGVGLEPTVLPDLYRRAMRASEELQQAAA